MSEQDVGMGVMSFPSVKKGMVAPVDKQNRSGYRLPPVCSAAPGVWLKAEGDIVTGWPVGSCWEWLLVGISSLATPPAPRSSSRLSSAGGALGVTPGAHEGVWSRLDNCLVGDKFTAMFPM